jgi:hypothetical protein
MMIFRQIFPREVLIAKSLKLRKIQIPSIEMFGIDTNTSHTDIRGVSMKPTDLVPRRVSGQASCCRYRLRVLLPARINI